MCEEQQRPCIRYSLILPDPVISEEVPGDRACAPAIGRRGEGPYGRVTPIHSAVQRLWAGQGRWDEAIHSSLVPGQTWRVRSCECVDRSYSSRHRARTNTKSPEVETIAGDSEVPLFQLVSCSSLKQTKQNEAKIFKNKTIFEANTPWKQSSAGKIELARVCATFLSPRPWRPPGRLVAGKPSGRMLCQARQQTGTVAVVQAASRLFSISPFNFWLTFMSYFCVWATESFRKTRILTHLVRWVIGNVTILHFWHFLSHRVTALKAVPMFKSQRGNCMSSLLSLQTAASESVFRKASLTSDLIPCANGHVEGLRLPLPLALQEKVCHSILTKCSTPFVFMFHQSTWYQVPPAALCLCLKDNELLGVKTLFSVELFRPLGIKFPPINPEHFFNILFV